MRRFFTYLCAGALLSSVSMLACSDDSGNGRDDDSDGGTSSSGNNGGGSSGNNNGGSSGNGNGSSSGEPAPTFTISNFAISPAEGVAGTQAAHTATFQFEGNLAEGMAVVLAPMAPLPDGVQPAQLQTAIQIQQPTVDGNTASVPFNFTPPAAGTYNFTGGIDVDGNVQTNDDAFLAATGASVEVTAP